MDTVTAQGEGPRGAGRGIHRWKAYAFVAVLLLCAGVYYVWSRRVCCAPPPVLLTGEVPERPADFAVKLGATSGSVTPNYQFEYTVSVAADGRAEATYAPRWGSEALPTWRHEFTVTPALMDSLYRESAEQALENAPGQVADDQIPIGGGSATLIISANGRVTEIQPFQRGGWEPRVETYRERIRALVSDSVWQHFRGQMTRWAGDHPYGTRAAPIR